MENLDIGRIAELIVKKLIIRSRSVLLAFCGSPLGMDQIRPQLKRLHEEGYCFGIYATAAARQILDIKSMCRELEAIDCSQDPNSSRCLSMGSALLIPTLTANTATKVALGISDTPLLNIISNALMRGSEVVASSAGCCPDSPERLKAGLNKLSPAYHEMLARHMETLENYGVRFARPEDFYDTVKEATKLRMIRVEKPESDKLVPDRLPVIASPFSAGRELTARPFGSALSHNHVVTLSDVITARRNSTIELPGNALLTPSAREHIKDLKITIVRKS